MQIVKMFGPSISDPTKIVNRDVPACDEQVYVRAGYKRGSISEVPAVAEDPKPPVKSLSLPMDESEPVDSPVATESITDKTARPRKRKGQI